MSELIKKYKYWGANPADYGYDCIGEFITDLTECETIEFMEWVGKLSDEQSNYNIPLVSGCSLLNIVEADKTYKLANELKDYVSEHLYKWDMVKHRYNKTFAEWKEQYNR